MDNQKKIEEGPERAPLSTEDLAEWKGMCFQAEMFPGGHAVSVLFLASRTAMPKLIAEVERLSSARTHDCNVLNLLIDDERALRQIAEERAEKAEAALAETKKENERILVEVDRWVREKDAEIARLHAEVLHMRQTLQSVRPILPREIRDGNTYSYPQMWIDKALSSDAGKALLERVEKLEKVAEAARGIPFPSSFGFSEIKQALAVIDGKEG